MTDRLTISPDQADDLRNGWVKVPMPGWDEYGSRWGKALADSMPSIIVERRPDPDWLAAAKSCETCKGYGVINLDCWRQKFCPDCDGTGHPTVEFVTECSQPLRTMGGAYHPGDCCDGFGLVTVARGRILRVVPAMKEWGRDDPAEFVYFGFDPSGAGALFIDGKNTGCITVPADTKPGDWLAQVVSPHMPHLDS